MDVIYAINHPEYETCGRAKLTWIGTDQTVAEFIDYGDFAGVPLSNIHPCPESVQETPPMAIECYLMLNVPDEFHETSDYVRLPEEAVEEEKVVEAVSCGEDGGVYSTNFIKLIRSLWIEGEDLVGVIEETIENSDYDLQEFETELTEMAECSICMNRGKYGKCGKCFRNLWCYTCCYHGHLNNGLEQEQDDFLD